MFPSLVQRLLCILDRDGVGKGWKRCCKRVGKAWKGEKVKEWERARVAEARARVELGRFQLYHFLRGACVAVSQVDLCQSGTGLKLVSRNATCTAPTSLKAASDASDGTRIFYARLPWLSKKTMFMGCGSDLFLTSLHIPRAGVVTPSQPNLSGECHRNVFCRWTSDMGVAQTIRPRVTHVIARVTQLIVFVSIYHGQVQF